MVEVNRASIVIASLAACAVAAILVFTVVSGNSRMQDDNEAFRRCKLAGGVALLSGSIKVCIKREATVEEFR